MRMKDLAELAGVSVSTVSRALSGKGNLDDSTRKRLQKLANQLHYRPSAQARNLALQRTDTILFLAPNIATYYYAELARTLSEACREQGYRMVLGHTGDNPEVEVEYLNMALEGAVDGAIVRPLSESLERDCLMSLARNNFPLVLLETPFEQLRLSQVSVDNRLGAEMAATYLFEKGHRNIAFMGDVILSPPRQQRLQGYLDAHQKKGQPVREDYVNLNIGGGKDVEAGISALLALKDPPTAIVAFNDIIALGCIASVLRHGCRVPADMAVIGFDDIDISSHIGVALTTVRQPQKEVAHATVKQLIELIELHREKKELPIHEVIFKPELVIRESA
jgi:DNA-binding LacI/PurR family transcriptional regulator